MATMKAQRSILLVLVIAIAGATVATHHLWGLKGSEPLLGEDIFHVWREGQRLAEGVNPYARIIGKSLRENDKYPTYLPLSYLFTALLQRLGIREFPDFIGIWRAINLVCHLGIGLLIFDIYNRERKPISGLIACSILLLGRWGAYIINVQHLEFAALLPILAAGHQLRRRPRLSALLFGLSLCVKQVGIILLPCFLLGLRSENRSDRPGRPINLWSYSALAVALPLLISLPFLFDQPAGFLLNIAFSATRNPSNHGLATGSEMILMGVDGTRVLMVALIAANWFAQAREKINFWLASAITLLIFLQFNPVIFAQYFIWLASFLLVAFAFLTPVRPSTTPSA
jgi:hypothetical protein